MQIALRREKMGESAPFWRFSASSYPDLEGTISSALLSSRNERINDNLVQPSGVSNAYSFI